MKKYLIGSLAIVLAVGFSAFTKPVSFAKRTTADYWYSFSGTQSSGDRQDASKYDTPTQTNPSCSGSINECSVKVTITLDANNQPPAHPDFTGASFDGDGIPQVGGPVVANRLLL